LWERESDQLAKTEVASAVAEAFRAMPLDVLVSEVASVIDSVDEKLIEKFWRQAGGA
jgi:hypothetical protein